MKQRLTYPNKFVVILTLLFISSSCATQKTKQTKDLNVIEINKFYNTFVNTGVHYKSLYSDNLNLRIDYKGELRTFKSSLYHVVDSIIYISIISNFSVPVASFIAKKDEILLIDQREKIIYISSYDMLMKNIGFPVNYNLIQSTFFAQTDCLRKINNLYPDSITKQISDNSLEILLKCSNPIFLPYLIYIYNIDLNSSKLKHFDIINYDIPVLQSNYIYTQKQKQSFLDNIYIDFNYQSEPMTIEMDFKNVEFNATKNILVDSSFTFRVIENGL